MIWKKFKKKKSYDQSTDFIKGTREEELNFFKLHIELASILDYNHVKYGFVY